MTMSMGDLYDDEPDNASPASINNSIPGDPNSARLEEVHVVQDDCTIQKFLLPINLVDAIPLSFLFPAGPVNGWRPYFPTTLTIVRQFEQDNHYMYSVRFSLCPLCAFRFYISSCDPSRWYLNPSWTISRRFWMMQMFS
jgi:hypothetical protein